MGDEERCALDRELLGDVDRWRSVELAGIFGEVERFREEDGLRAAGSAAEAEDLFEVDLGFDDVASGTASD